MWAVPKVLLIIKYKYLQKEQESERKATYSQRDHSGGTLRELSLQLGTVGWEVEELRGR